MIRRQKSSNKISAGRNTRIQPIDRPSYSASVVPLVPQQQQQQQDGKQLVRRSSMEKVLARIGSVKSLFSNPEKVILEESKRLELENETKNAEFEFGEKGDEKVIVKIGCCSHEGPYHENEDRYSQKTPVNEMLTGYVGIFDGHGGEQCAEYASKVMSIHVEENFTSLESWDSGEETMMSMFHDLEREFVDIAREEFDTSGSCATVVLVNGYEALVGNIGDCRAVCVDQNGEVQVLTADHRADLPSECMRINSCGGQVINGRIFNLQPSRSFGDLDVKEVAPDNCVIPTPEVCRVTMNDKSFMIVATDGLWDTVTSSEAAEFALEVLEMSDYDADICAEKLVRLAVENRATDDVTVAVLVW